MLARWCILAMLGCGRPAATMVDTPRDLDSTDVAATPALVEGYVRDSLTGAPVPGVDIEVWLGPLDNGKSAARTISNEHGFFTLEVKPGTGFLLVSPGESDDAPRLELRAGARMRIDVTVNPLALAAHRAMNPREACPSSPPGTIIEGHTTTQQDRDDLARTVLERSLTDSRGIPDLGMAERAGLPTAVRTDVGPHMHLSARALPSNQFVLKTLAELQAEADRSNTNVGYIEFWRIYSNGSCAILDVGGDFVLPSSSHFGMLCCCSARDMYEKRGNRWVFVRRMFEACA